MNRRRPTAVLQATDLVRLLDALDTLMAGTEPTPRCEAELSAGVLTAGSDRVWGTALAGKRFDVGDGVERLRDAFIAIPGNVLDWITVARGIEAMASRIFRRLGRLAARLHAARVSPLCEPGPVGESDLGRSLRRACGALADARAALDRIRDSQIAAGESSDAVVRAAFERAAHGCARAGAVLEVSISEFAVDDPDCPVDPRLLVAMFTVGPIESIEKLAGLAADPETCAAEARNRIAGATCAVPNLGMVLRRGLDWVDGQLLAVSPPDLAAMLRWSGARYVHDTELP